jgi:hypothetical protein
MRRHATVTRVLVIFIASLGIGRPASAQVVDFSGVWAALMHEDQPERVAGPEVGDYLGLPINDAMRLRGESWEASILTMPEHQCKPHPSTYGFRGIGNLRIWNDVEDATQRLIKIDTQIQWMEQKREIWMDGRPHPAEYEKHTWGGFSTGRYEQGQLVVSTTHLKAGWIRRNGLALSDKATMQDRFIRHGDTLTHVYIISDPVYLTEPLIKTNGFRLTNQLNVQPYPCESVVEVPRERGAVPHRLPGQNPYLTEFAERFKLPYEPTRGGAETALPEYAKKVASMPVATKAASAPATAATGR